MIAAIEAGVPVTLTVHGRPVADVVPHRHRQERRPAAIVYAELDEVAELARRIGVAGRSDLSD